jgi:hypothetical protein
MCVGAISRSRSGDRSHPPSPIADDRSEWFIIPAQSTQEVLMSKGMDSKKNVKKQPTKTLKEKREAKKAKKS